MTKIFGAFCLIFILSGCTSSLLVSLVAIPSSNHLTREHYEEKYRLYDTQYNQSVTFREHRIPREMHTLYAREFGDQTGEEKPVIIIMHGFPDSLHIYDRLAPLLANRYRVISFDFLGWGRSDKPKNHTYNTDSLYQDLEAVIGYFNFVNVSLVVHDASGPPGIDWALNNPEKMETLILLNTFYHPMDDLLKPEAIATFSTPGFKRTFIRTAANISNYGWKIGYQNQLSKFFYDDEQRDIMMPVLTHQAMDVRNAFFQLNNVLDKEASQRSDNKQRLSDYKGKVKIIFGNEDPYLNSRVALEFNRMLENSSMFSIDKAAHFVQLDKPKEVANIILDSNISILLNDNNTNLSTAQ